MPGLAASIKEKKPTQTPSALNGRAIVDVNVKPLLLVIKKIMHLATTGISGIIPLKEPEVSDEKILSETSLVNMHDLLVDTVSKISCEISCKCSDVHTTTQTINETLSNYKWEAQIVIALAAFAVNYGNFWLVSQLSQTNKLAKYVEFLQQLPSVLEPAHDTLKLKFRALIDVIKAVLEVTDCIFEIKDLPSQYISWNTPPFSTANAYIRQAAYLIIQSIVICSSYITQLTSTELIYMDSSHVEHLKVSTQGSAVMSTHEKLKTQLDLCQKHVETAKDNAAVAAWGNLFEATYTDNQTLVTAMFSANNQSLLVDYRNTMVELGKLKGKTVLLFISGLNVTREDLTFFHQYSHNNLKKEGMEYQIVWVQMVDDQRITELQNQCVEKLNSLPWYMVRDPTCLGRGLIRYIKEVWQFKYGKPRLVEIDHRGRVVSHNAIFKWLTPNGPEKEVTWSIQYLAAYSFDPQITQWVQTGEYICLYGGDNIEWIEKFQQKVATFKEKNDIKMNMLYVGKSNRKENVRNCVKKFVPGEDSEAFMMKIRAFWLRLESMWDSKMLSIKDNNIMKEILTLLSLDGSNQGWALISDCSSNMAKGKGDLIETCLDEYEKWKVGLKDGESFVPKLNEYLRAIMIVEDHCCLPVILPSTIDIIPEVVPCLICDKPMKRMATYRCCKD